jgi:hypothetical protein
MLDNSSGVIIEQRRKNEQKKKSPVPAGIEVIACNEQQDILRSHVSPQQNPVRYKHDRQKQGEMK